MMCILLRILTSNFNCKIKKTDFLPHCITKMNHFNWIFLYRGVENVYALQVNLLKNVITIDLSH